MKRRSKGIALPLALLIVFLGGTGAFTGLSIALAHNKAILPDNALYGLKEAGRAIECAFSKDKVACRARILAEREEELKNLKEMEGVSKELIERLERKVENERRVVEVKIKKERVDLRNIYLPFIGLQWQNADRICQQAGGTWHWEEDFVGCEKAQSPIFDCSDDTILLAIHYCQSVHGHAHCDSYNAYCKYTS